MKNLMLKKMEVLRALDIEPISYLEASKIRNSKDETIDAKKVFFDYAQNDSIKGPAVSNSRYITEDVSQGLVLLESLGELLDVGTSVCSALIDIASACLNTDFRENGRTVKRLGGRILTDLLGIKKIKH